MSHVLRLEPITVGLGQFHFCRSRTRSSGAKRDLRNLGKEGYHLSCGRCGKHMCTQCMVQAPVGIRCRDCGKAQRMPTYDVRPTYYARAISVALVSSVGAGVLWGTLPSSPSHAHPAQGY